MTFVVFPPGPSDAEDLARVHVASWRETYRGLLSDAFLARMSEPGFTRRFRRALASPEADVTLAAADRFGLVGYAQGGPSRRQAPGEAEIVTLYILRQAQGAGLGKRLMVQAARALAAKGATSLMVSVLRDNIRARGFYEHLGGEPEAARREPGPGGRLLYEVAYRWRDIAALTGSRRLGLTLAGAVAAAALSARAEPPKLMDWPDLMGRPLPRASASVAYGPDPLQVAEVWRPDGKGPFPTVLMIHGGCWRSGLSNLHIMNYAAEDLRRRGVAVWNIEHRGVDRPGGGYPGTFQDVNAAADALMAHGRDYGLKTSGIVVLGHSAGGQLALWLAARRKLPAASPLHDARRLDVVWAVSLGGLPDLATAKEGCGEKTVARLLAGSARPDPLSDTSPASLLPTPAARMLIHGGLDDTAPPAQGRAYVARARAAEDIRAWSWTVPGDGHVEEIAPGSATWAAVTLGLESVFHSKDASWLLRLTPGPL